MMKKLRLLVMALVAGFALLLAADTMLNKFSEPSDEEIAQAIVADREKSLGYSCKDVRQRARAFIKGPLAEIVRTGEQGGNWRLLAHQNHREEIRFLTDASTECWLMDSTRLKAKLISQNGFDATMDLFLDLYAYTLPFRPELPSARALPGDISEKIHKASLQIEQGL